MVSPYVLDPYQARSAINPLAEKLREHIGHAQIRLRSLALFSGRASRAQKCASRLGSRGKRRRRGVSPPAPASRASEPGREAREDAGRPSSYGRSDTAHAVSAWRPDCDSQRARAQGSLAVLGLSAMGGGPS